MMLKIVRPLLFSSLVFIVPVSQAADAKQLYESCAACHGNHGEGGIGPRLKGHTLSDITHKLHLYKEGHTVGPLSSLAIPIKEKLSEAEMNALADYISKFK